jgi:hypothetical protein
MAILKHNNNSISNVTSFAQVPAGDMKLLSTATASSSASLEFNSTYINSDYKIYKFEFINIHPQTDATSFNFNLSTDNGSNYNVTKTTTSHYAYHYENDSATLLAYWDTQDLAQSTSDKRIMSGIGNANDESGSGELYLFAPSSTTYVKHFICTTNFVYNADLQFNNFTAGYGNTTSAINAIRFKMESGNLDAGQIKLYGIGAN